MSDLGTMRQRIKEELPRMGEADTARITRAIITAIRFYRHHKLFFNEGLGATFNTTIGESEYGSVTEEGASAGYPNDLLGIINVHAQISSNVWCKVGSTTVDVIRELNSSTNYRGYPDYFAWFEKKLILAPTPHIVFTVRLDYVKDIGTPVAVYTGGAWDFDDETGAALTDAYTNAWFTDGEELIRIHAKVDLAENLFKGDRESAVLRRREKEIYDQIKDRGRAYRNRQVPIPWL